MAIELIITSGDDEPRRQRFEEGVVTIGRDPTSSIRFDMASDRHVSTRHAEIRMVDGRYEIVDKDSTNGTWVNGARARWPHQLHAGDVINLGRGGPELRVVILGDEMWHETEALPVRPGPVHPHPALASQRIEERVADLVESRTRALWVAVASALGGIALLGAVGWMYLRSMPADQRAWDDATTATIAKANGDAVALIETRIPGSECSGGCEGTGFAITRDGLLVTNRHVVEQHGVRATGIRVKFANTGNWIQGSIVRVPDDTSVDLALVQLTGTGPYPSVVSVSEKSADVPVGSAVMTIGFPLGTALKMEGTGANAIAVTTVTLGSIGKVLSGLIQIDARANHGSSGSPVFDRHGHAIGVVSSGARDDDRILYVVPSQFIRDLQDGTRRSSTMSTSEPKTRLVSAPRAGT